MPNLHTTLWTYPWDLAEEDPKAVAAKLKNEIGLDGISLASAYHSFEMLRPRSTGKILLQIPRAAVYFQPQADLYTSTSIQPHVSPLMGKGNWYASAAEATAAAGLDLIAWTVFLHNSHQAGAHPECAEVTCTGDVSTSRLCPANPNVRAYATGIARDLVQNYGISLLECESLSYGGFGHTHYHVKHGVELGPGGRFLLSLCFCDSCCAEAKKRGLDPTALSQAAQTHLRRALASGHAVPESPEELIERTPDLASFVRMREEIVASLVREVRETGPISFIWMGNPHTAGFNRKEIAGIADYSEILSYTPDADRTARTVQDLVPDLPSPAHLIVGLQAYLPASPDAETLAKNLKRASSLGVRRFSFYNFGIMPAPNLQWVKQAIKIARNA